MKQKELIKEYKRILEEDNIDFSTPSKHFKSLRNTYMNIQDGIASKINFFDSTVALFTEVNKPRRKEDFKSEGGSRYRYSEKGLIRGSNHWGNRVANCDWALKQKNGKTTYGYSAWSTSQFSQEKFGFVKWEDFVLKPQLLKIKNKEVLTTFKNKIGRDIIKIDKKKYQAIPKIIWKEI